MNSRRKGTTRKSASRAVAKTAPAVALTTTSAGMPLNDGLLLLARLRRADGYRRLANRLGSDLFPGNLALLREAITQWFQKNPNAEQAAVPGLEVLTKKLAGKKGWVIVEPLFREFAQIPVPDDRVIDAYLEEYIRREGLRRIAMEIGTDLDRGDKLEPRAVRSRFDRLIFSLERETERKVHYRGAEKNYMRHFLVGRVPTGIARVDGYMEGGLGKGELGMVIAPYNRGKTSFLINLGANAVLAGKRVLHLTLELSRWLVLLRYDMRFGTMTSRELIDKPALAEKARKLALANGGDLTILDYSHESMTPSRIEALIEATQPIDLVCLDYADLLRSDRHLDGGRQEVDEVYQDLRRIASAHEIPIWTASQGNRDASKKPDGFDGSDISDSIGKPRIADHVLCLRATDQEMIMGRMGVLVDKTRLGASRHTVPIMFDFTTMTIAEVTDVLNTEENTNVSATPEQRGVSGRRGRYQGGKASPRVDSQRLGALYRPANR